MSKAKTPNKSLNRRGHELGILGKGYCPRCGASPCHQRWKPKDERADLSVMEHAGNFSLVDAIQCPKCGMAFSISRLETDGEFIVDWSTQYEYVPNYCPQCGYQGRWANEHE